MKFIALLVAVAAIFPMALLIQSVPALRKNAWTILGILPFLIPTVPEIDVALITWDNRWVGYVYGIEVSLLDIFAISLFFTVKNRVNRTNYHFPFLLYLAAIAYSFTNADEPMAALFYFWQFLKVYVVVIIVSRAAFDEQISSQLIRGLALGLGLQLIAVVWQRWGQGVIQPSGTFTHQNTLGLAIHFVVFPHMMLLLAGLRRLQFIVIPVMGPMIAAITASRAALGFCVLGLGICYLVSCLRRWTQHKTRMVLIGALGIAVLAPIAFNSLQKRFEAAPLNEVEYDERAAFNRAALMILHDSPMGVGANHYVHEAKNFGYSIRAGVVPFEGNLNNIVHNAYLLAASETGYIGAAAFILVLITPMVVAFRYGWQARQTRLGDLLLGCGITLLVVSMHSTLEFIFFGKDIQYLFGIIVGIIYGSTDRIRALVASAPAAHLRGFEPVKRGV
jgi:hypothetical protein